MTETGEFAGKTALITGAASGIGAACARWLDNRGIGRLVLIDRDKMALDALPLSCAADRIHGDVADPSLWVHVSGHLDGLAYAVINAGVPTGGAVAEIDIVEWRRVMGINLDGAFMALRAALRPMIKAKSGSIVTVGSATALKAEPGTATYAASKAAVMQMSKIAAREVAGKGVRVNVIAPGGVDTAIWDATQGFDSMIAKAGSRDALMANMAQASTPMGRFASPDEIAGQIGFLLSDAAGYMTGHVLTSDGGYSL